VVPVTAHVDRTEGHHDEVPHAGGDLLLAAGAEVGLPCLEGMNLPNLHVGGSATVGGHG
jgi:hypothetical protein